MLTFRIALLCAALLLAGCPKRGGGDLTVGTHVQPKFRQSFKTVLTPEQCGPNWDAIAGGHAIRSIESSADGHQTLILLRGADTPALWVDRVQMGEVRELRLGQSAPVPDVERAMAYAVNEGASETDLAAYVQRALPEGDWTPVAATAAPQPGETVQGASHPGAEGAWLLERRGIATASSQPQAGQGIMDRIPPTFVAEPLTTTAELWAVHVSSGSVQETLVQTQVDVETPLQLAALGDSAVAVSIGPTVYRLASAGGTPAAIYTAPAGREFTLGADATGPEVWIYLHSVGANAGSERAADTEQPGELIVIDTGGTELGRTALGQASFSEFAGQWEQQRCILCRSAAGVAVADLANDTLSWPLRSGGDTPLYLVGGGREVWAVMPDEIAGIGTDELLSLSPSLAASQVLPREDLQLVSEVVDALGWNLPDVQVSPLIGRTGRLTLFNTADADSEWAELDWSASRKHVSRLMLARGVSEADAPLRDEATGEAQLKQLLALMGWPEAALLSPAVNIEGDMQAIYALSPAPVPGGSQGEFRLWINDEATVMTLEAPTQPLPDGALDAAAARAKAAELAAGVVSENGADVRVGLQPQAGWAPEGTPHALMPEVEGKGVAVWAVNVLGAGPRPQLHTLYIDAVSGELLESREQGSSPLRMMGLDARFGPPGEFASGKSPGR
jgi:hypothetical protein